MGIYQVKLLKRYEAARNTIVLEFEKPNGFTFKPGQYGGFTLVNPSERDDGGITRRFSLVGTPDDENLVVATRIQNSAFKRELTRLPIGGEIKFAGPTGSFTLHEASHVPAVLIAGGIGITPFYCIVRDVYAHQPDRLIYLFYGNQTSEDALFLPELLALQKNFAQFKLIITIANPETSWNGETGFITNTMIRKYIKNIDEPFYYVCGSPVMVTTLQETLAEMGVDEDRIKIEDFPGY